MKIGDMKIVLEIFPANNVREEFAAIVLCEFSPGNKYPLKENPDFARVRFLYEGRKDKVSELFDKMKSGEAFYEI